MSLNIAPSEYRFGRFSLQPAERRLLADGEQQSIGPRAFDVLVVLVERAGQLIAKNELLDLVWPGLVVEENNLQVQVSALRKILGNAAIATVAGRGYRFALPIGTGTVPHASSPVEKPPIADVTDKPSIAVLPFVNMSGDEENEYFADGLAEELLNVLSKIRGLRVVSRTSAFSFKGAKVDIPTMAQKLNVATILEGSVRKSGNRVRIRAQLIHVATDSHLWSETYDRELEDIFAVQDDIAQSVVKELRAALMGERPDAAAVKAEIQTAARGRGDNAEAYRLYLQANFHHDRYTAEDFAIAIQAYLRRVAARPGLRARVGETVDRVRPWHRAGLARNHPRRRLPARARSGREGDAAGPRSCRGPCRHGRDSLCTRLGLEGRRGVVRPRAGTRPRQHSRHVRCNVSAARTGSLR